MKNYQNILNITSRKEFRNWLINNSKIEKECYIILKRGKPKDDGLFYYLDAVEEALCFGWIDSTLTLVNDQRMQRFAPRSKNSHWSELNKERARRLIKLNLMDKTGLEVLPDLNKEYKIDKSILTILKKYDCLDTFLSFPLLYQKIRVANLLETKKNLPKTYRSSLKHFIEKTKKGEMYGEWNDYGRLI